MKIVTLIFLLMTCSISSLLANEIKSENLIGVWGNSDDGGMSIWGYDQYLSDGTFKSWGEIPGTTINYEVEGIYQLKHKFMTSSCLTVNKTSHPNIMPIGESWCDELIELNDITFTFKSVDGDVATLYRQD